MNSSLVGVDLFDFSMDQEPPRIKIEPLKISQASPTINDIKQEAVTPLKKSTSLAAAATTNNKRYYCEACNIHMNSQCVYDQHLIGKQHLKKTLSIQQPQPVSKMKTKIAVAEVASTKQQEVFSCELCSVIGTSKEQIDMHLVGKRHLSKVSEITGDHSFKKYKRTALSDSNIINNTQATDTTASIEPKPDQKPIAHRCEVCNLSLTCKEQLDMHLLGKKHRAKVAKLSGGSESTPVVAAAAAATVATADPSLTAAATTGAVAVSSNNLKKKSLDEEEKFAHLNIAWDKYKIANQVISEPRPKNIGEEYEFYCSMCKKFMQRKMQLVDHLKSKKHHKKIYEKRMQNSKPPTTVNNMPKKLLNKGLNKRPIKFVNSSNPPTLESLKAGLTFPNYSQAFSQYQQSNQISNSYSAPHNNNSQLGQASFKSAAVQYNQYGSYKRKSPALTDTCYTDNHFDAKYRKNNESMSIGNTNILSNNTNISNNTSSFDPSMYNNQLNAQTAPPAGVGYNWNVPAQAGQSSLTTRGQIEPTMSSNDGYQTFFKQRNSSGQNYMQYTGGGNRYSNSQQQINNDQSQSNLIGRFSNM